MKRIIVVFAFIAACFGASGVMAAPASAANCNVSASYTQEKYGTVYYTASLLNCTDVSQVQFVRDNFQCPGCPHSGWADNTLQQWIMGGFRGWPGQSTVTDNIACDGCGAQEQVSRTCWWGGASVHNVVGYFIYRIKGRASGQFGPLHDYVFPAASYPYCP